MVGAAGRSPARSAARTFRIDLAYDGTDFHGWARQGELPTIQSTLEAALERALRAPVRLAVAGRTDAGVHAAGQVASFRGMVDDPDRAARAVNGMVGPAIAVRAIRPVADDFHARVSATAREYRYRIRTDRAPDPFGHRFAWWLPEELALVPMRRAAAALVGEHDFAAFCRRPPTGGTVRRLERLTVVRSPEGFEVGARANAFLHQMVRSLVRVLVEVGRGRIDPAEVGAILAAGDRSRTPGPAPAQGLTLERVVYGRRRPGVGAPLTQERSRR
ncbi:MAG: tRNA pseudouridine(38-40) synthase TruA [Actinomycetota bacterium]